MLCQVGHVHASDLVGVEHPAFSHAIDQALIVASHFLSGGSQAFSRPQGGVAQAASVEGRHVLGVAFAVNSADAFSSINLTGDFYELIPGQVLGHFDAQLVGQGLVVQQGGSIHAGAHSIDAVANLTGVDNVLGNAAQIQGAAFHVGGQVQQAAVVGPQFQVSVVLLHQIRQVMVCGISGHQCPVVIPNVGVQVKGDVGIVFRKEVGCSLGYFVTNLVAPPGKANFRCAGRCRIIGANRQPVSQSRQCQGYQQHERKNQ